MPGDRRERRTYLVDRSAQARASFAVVGWMYAYLLGFAVLANLPAIRGVVFEPSGSAAHRAAAADLTAFVRFAALPLALTFVCMTLHCLLLTHRIFGPVHRFRHVLRQMAAGRFPEEVRLRRKDQMHDLAAEFTLTLAALREQAALGLRLNRATLLAGRTLLEALEDGGATPAEVEGLARDVLDAARETGRHLAAAEAPTQGEAGGERIPMPAPELELPSASELGTLSAG